MNYINHDTVDEDYVSDEVFRAECDMKNSLRNGDSAFVTI
jgi:hypothetical protein